MKAFIEANFNMLDFDGDGVVGAKEFRYNCITRIAVDNIQAVDDAFNKLLDVMNFLDLIFSNWIHWKQKKNVSYFYCFLFFETRMKIVDGVDWHWQDIKNCMVTIWATQTKHILVSTFSDHWAYKRILTTFLIFIEARVFFFIKKSIHLTNIWPTFDLSAVTKKN